MKANLLGFDVLCYLAQTAARRSLSGSRSHRASGAPGCRSGGDNVAMWIKSGEPGRLRLQARTHVEAFVRGEKLGHGAEGHGVRAAVLQRLRRLAHQQAGRHQPGGHFCQFELEKLQRERIPEGSGLVLRGVETRLFDSPGCWTASRRTASVPTGDLLRAVRRRAPPPENRRLLVVK